MSWQLTMFTALIAIVIGCLGSAILSYVKNRSMNKRFLEHVNAWENSCLRGTLFIDDSSGEIYSDFGAEFEDDTAFVVLEVKHIHSDE